MNIEMYFQELSAEQVAKWILTNAHQMRGFSLAYDFAKLRRMVEKLLMRQWQQLIFSCRNLSKP